MKKIKSNYLLIIPLLVLLTACADEVIIPKPKGYQRIDFPAKKYFKVVNPCNYSMEIPVYSEMVLDKYPNAEQCWYNIQYKPFNVTLHLSYNEIKSRDSLFKFINDSRTMVYKHIIKADEIIENYISKPNKHGIFYELDGSTATNAQFYITDSTHHFLRGSLYFNSATNQDSIMPVLNFLKEDMLKMIETLEWKNN